MNISPIGLNNNIKTVKFPVFKAFWKGSQSNISQKFQYGLEALDNQSIFVVTSNEESSNMMLELYSEKIPIPVMKKITLLVKKGELDNCDELAANFAIFKFKNDYYIISLADYSLKKLLVDRPKENFNKDNIIPQGEIRRLSEGVIIHTGEMVYPSSGGKHKFVFSIPSKSNSLNALSYLDVKNIDRFDEFNKRTISSLNSSVKKNNESDRGITFEDIGGLDDVIETLKKYVVRPINYPQVYENIRLNKGILLYGPPRCGKTLLGKALASEANAVYREYNANEFVSPEVGSSENNIREVFKQAVADAPSITFIDELDSVAKTRDGSANARFDDPLVNQLLGCMSDLEKCAAPAFIIAATNMKKLIDPALLATGRFGLHIEVPLPNLEGIKQIFKIHSKKQNISKDVSIDAIVRNMHENRFTGSDVAEAITDAFFNVLDRLGLNKKMDNKTFGYSDMAKIVITKADFIKAIQRIVKQK